MILRGLQRSLRPLREDWDMEFLDSGETALARMTQASFDVVVSDMRMPGMNGTEFLRAVMHRYPETTRLVLSGHADNELTLKCIDFAHFYLAKPCDDAALMGILRRTSDRRHLPSVPIRQLIGRISNLPSIPGRYLEIVQIANEAGASLERIAEVIASDPGTTTQILRVVNSAFFGLGREIASLEEAVAHLGLDLVKALVLSIDAAAQFAPLDCGHAKMKSLWAHHLAVASAAKLIAQHERADRKMVCEAFTAGILHDIGKLVLAANFPGDYASALQLAEQEKLEICTAEVRVLGADHAEVGAYLLGLWGLPAPVVEAVALHHVPSAAVQPSFSPLTIVHAANVLVSEIESGTGGSLPLDENYLSTVGAGDRANRWRDLLCSTQSLPDHS